MMVRFILSRCDGTLGVWTRNGLSKQQRERIRPSKTSTKECCFNGVGDSGRFLNILTLQIEAADWMFISTGKGSNVKLLTSLWIEPVVTSKHA
jgi:hypothetical protein